MHHTTHIILLFIMISSLQQKIFSWMVLAINMISFLFICISYVSINRYTKRTGKALGRIAKNKEMKKNKNKLQIKITAIIATGEQYTYSIPNIVVI